MIEVTRFNAKELDLYARLNEVQAAHYLEPAPGLFIAESAKVVERALSAGFQAHSFLLEKSVADKMAYLTEQCPDVPVYVAKLPVLTRLTGYNLTGGVLAAMYRKPTVSFETLLRNPRLRRIAVLEGVVNPTNVGAIIRSAAALNMDAVLLAPGCADPLYRRAIRVSMGTVFQLPWAYLPESSGWKERGANLLRSFGFKTAAMALREASIDIDDPALHAEDRLAVILGAEGDGLSETTIATSDYTVMIPMSHHVDSLNVAAAGAVAFWQLAR